MAMLYFLLRAGKIQKGLLGLLDLLGLQKCAAKPQQGTGDQLEAIGAN